MHNVSLHHRKKSKSSKHITFLLLLLISVLFLTIVSLGERQTYKQSAQQPVFPTMTVSPSATATATLTPPPITTAPTAPALPTQTPMLTLTATPQATSISFRVFLHGIGKTGDNINPGNSALSNKNPRNPQRQFTVNILNTSNQVIQSKIVVLSYSSIDGSYIGTVDLGINWIGGTGLYTIKLKTDSFLERSLPDTHFTAGKQIIVPPFQMITGDANNDNMLSMLDFNAIVSCFNEISMTKTCNDTQKRLVDLNDDGSVNQLDYNLFLRELRVGEPN